MTEIDIIFVLDQQHVNNLEVHSHLTAAEPGQFVISWPPTNKTTRYGTKQHACSQGGKPSDWPAQANIVNAQHRLCASRRNISLWISEATCCTAHCVLFLLQLICVLHYNHRRQQCLHACISLWTWMLEHTHTHTSCTASSLWGRWYYAFIILLPQP